jgi:hypothetical protein
MDLRREKVKRASPRHRAEAKREHQKELEKKNRFG